MIKRRRRVKSRKRLTQKEALKRISNLMMEYQAEKEMQIALSRPMDKTMKLILTMTGVDDVEKAKEQNKENLDYIEWKIREDYGRYVNVGTHKLDAHPYTYTKTLEGSK